MKHFHFLILAILTLLPSLAQARVDLLPHLLVMEGRQRSADLTVLNLGDQVNRFEIKYIHYRQNNDGAYTVLEEALHENFAPNDVVRMSPREFILDPRGKQKVRIAVRKPADLPDGEYRFHVLATGYELEGVENTQDYSERVGVGLKINVGIAIPVIVRHGDLEQSTSRLSNFNLLGPSQTDSGKPELKFRASREGETSVLGEMEVSWAPNGEDFQDIGFITNFNIFPEIDYRDGSIPLDMLPLGNGKLRILYRDTFTEEIYDEVVLEQ